jgi:hypothetical protein
LDPERLRAVLRALGRACRGPGTIYVTGGATALLEGWRNATVDLDLKLDPEPEGAFEAIARIKEEHQVNVELASPDQFLPELSDWRERSPLVDRFGPIEVRHYDLRAQALSKLARGFERDEGDVKAMLERGLIRCDELRAALKEMEPGLVRFPRLNGCELRARLEAVCSQHRDPP